MLSPDAVRLQAQDAVKIKQATAFIEASQMDQAKAVIANISDETARKKLVEMIQAKLPKASLDGF
jgi:hypothetical protein